MKYNIWFYCEQNLKSLDAILFEKKHCLFWDIWHCLLFAFQLTKNAAKAKEIISSALGETLYRTTHDLKKNDFNSFEREISTFRIVNALANLKKWKRRSWSKFWTRESLPNLTCKCNWNDSASPFLSSTETRKDLQGIPMDPS